MKLDRASTSIVVLLLYRSRISSIVAIYDVKYNINPNIKGMSYYIIIPSWLIKSLFNFETFLLLYNQNQSISDPFWLSFN